MGDYYRGQQILVRHHYKFIPHREPVRIHDVPVWHGPIRVPKRPTRSVTWWQTDHNSQPTPFKNTSLGKKNRGELLLRIFSEPDPIARTVASFLQVADINSLMYTCRNFKEALTGTGAWSWLLGNLVFGDEDKGATDAFNGLRRLENRLPFWDSTSVRIVLGHFDVSNILIRINLDYTSIDGSGIQWLLTTFPRLTRISIRYCYEIKMQDLQDALELYATTSNFAKIRLKDTYIDYWNSGEIYKVIYMMLVNQGLLSDIQFVAEKIRYISRLTRSNVFLCHKNHEDDGLWPADRSKFFEEHGSDANLTTFYPCEITDITCSLCQSTYERRYCLRCWPTQICSYCKEFHCVNCEPESYKSGMGL
ncbi:hypothetical protein ABW20_dc0101656 [Dactylellina cionopaga]|nr:hypothetical protein ABW20_dc0101656 [Dactylellina cionopaga]